MTEGDCLESTKPSQMLDYLPVIGKAGDRKLRLFAVACCRSIWHLITDVQSRHAVEVAERFADADASKLELQSARSAGLGGLS